MNDRLLLFAMLAVLPPAIVVTGWLAWRSFKSFIKKYDRTGHHYPYLVFLRLGGVAVALAVFFVMLLNAL